MYHSFLIHSSVDGHLGCFYVLAIIPWKAQPAFLRELWQHGGEWIRKTEETCWGSALRSCDGGKKNITVFEPRGLASEMGQDSSPNDDADRSGMYISAFGLRCNMWVMACELSCSTWDVLAWPGITKSQPLAHQGRPFSSLKLALENKV